MNDIPATTPADAPLPLTADSLAHALTTCGLRAGQTVVVHTAMRKLGYVVGGAEAVVLALLRVLSPDGTLIMPAHTSENTDPAQWSAPPVPENWWPVIRQHTPAYNPATTPTRQMGRVAELFRTWPGVMRSAHPVTSFAALGPQAAYLTGQHALKDEFGDESPLGRLYQLDGSVLLLGVDHANNTSLHVAEARAHWPTKRLIPQGSAMLLNGQRQWVEYETLDLGGDDFEVLGDAYEAAYEIPRHRIGSADVRFMRQAPLVDFAVGWIEANRR